MNEMPSSPTSGGGTHTPPGVTDELRLLRRSQTDRVIAGVLGGIGRRLGVDPVLLRVATAVLALFGGVGILLYLLAWLFMPADGEPASVLEQAIGRREVRDASAVPLALALGAGVVLSSGVILGGSWNGRVLLILAGVGLYALLRRRVAGDAAPTDRMDGYTPPGYDDAGYDESAWAAGWTAPAPPAQNVQGTPPAASQSDAADPTEVTYPSTSAQAAADPTDPAGPAGPADQKGPTDSADAAGAAGEVGTGWPEGPDWGPPAPEPSPYDNLYLRRESEQYPQTGPEEPRKDRPRSVLGLLTFCSALISVGVVAMVDAWSGVEPGPLYVAAPLAVVAVGLLIGTWFGRSRGLIMLGMLLVLALVPATFFSHWDLTTGPSSFDTPTTVEDLPTTTLTHGIGPMDYDLSELQLSDDDEVTITMQLGMGPMSVTVPENADVIVNGSVGAGVINIFDRTTNGFARELTVTDDGPDGPGGGQIELNLELGAGPIDVTRAEAGQ
jgi:phage shock protein PspC (stress-responsive transcriptional regulator)